MRQYPSGSAGTKTESTQDCCLSQLQNQAQCQIPNHTDHTHSKNGSTFSCRLSQLRVTECPSLPLKWSKAKTDNLRDRRLSQLRKSERRLSPLKWSKAMTDSVRECRLSQLRDCNKSHKPTSANTSKPGSKNQTNPPHLPHPSNQLQKQHCETKELYQYYVPFPRPLLAKCLQCNRAITKTTTPLSCDSYGKYCHKTCSNLPKALADQATIKTFRWSCEECNRDRSDHVRKVGGTTIETSHLDNGNYTAGIRVLQWNADGLRSKATELELMLQNHEFHIVCVQETKLLGNNQRTPKIKGYFSIRTDRPSLDGGGGLMFYIKEGVIFEVVGNSSHQGTEVSTIKVRLGKRKWALITNIYCPPNRTHNPVSLSLKHVIPGKRSLVTGDSNAHSGLWDFNQPEDTRGKDLLGWSIENQMTILRDESHSRFNHSATKKVPKQFP